jgi:hypothetical protein
MNAFLWAHIAGGSLALLAGAAAVAARKGGALHARAGTWFAVSMLVLGVTATILAQADDDTGLGLGGVITCYFVATSWMTARRRDGASGRFELAAGALALASAAAIAWSAWAGNATTPAGVGPLHGLAALCLLGGLGDLRAVVAGKLTPVQRLSRHLWRMCFAFFIATGSFFLGQQDVMPSELRGAAILFVLALTPLAVMVFWLVRLRFAEVIAQSKGTGLMFIGRRGQTDP